MPIPIYWVRLGPMTVVSLRDLVAFVGDDFPAVKPSGIPARLVTNTGLVFDLDPDRKAMMWRAVQQVIAKEGLLGLEAELPETDPDADRGGVPAEDHSGDPWSPEGLQATRLGRSFVIPPADAEPPARESGVVE